MNHLFSQYMVEKTLRERQEEKRWTHQGTDPGRPARLVGILRVVQLLRFRRTTPRLTGLEILAPSDAHQVQP